MKFIQEQRYMRIKDFGFRALEWDSSPAGMLGACLIHEFN